MFLWQEYEICTDNLQENVLIDGVQNARACMRKIAKKFLPVASSNIHGRQETFDILFSWTFWFEFLLQKA